MVKDGIWHYLAVKKISVLFTRLIPKHVGKDYCLNCLHSYRTENQLKKHYDVCNNHDYCYVETQKKDNTN